MNMAWLLDPNASRRPWPKTLLAMIRAGMKKAVILHGVSLKGTTVRLRYYPELNGELEVPFSVKLKAAIGHIQDW